MKTYDPVSIQEAIDALRELLNSGYGRDTAFFSKEHESRARIAALDVLERYLTAGGAQ